MEGKRDEIKVRIRRRNVISPGATTTCAVKGEPGLYMIQAKRSPICLPSAIIELDESGCGVIPVTDSTKEVLLLRPRDELTNAQSLCDEDFGDMSYFDFKPPEDTGKPFADCFEMAHLSPKQSTSLLEVLEKHTEVFLTDGKKLKGTNVAQYEVHLETSKPVSQPPYRIPKQYEVRAKELIQEMVEDGILQATNSPYSAPCVLVRRPMPDGTEKLRLCFDFPKLNQIQIKDRYPLPDISELITTLHGSKVWSTLDLASSFWQLKVHPRDRKKLAVILPFGTYECLRMPFGTANAPSTFVRMISQVLEGIEGIRVFVDDILCASPNFEDHMILLDQVLTKLEEADLMVKPEKVSLAKDHVKYLGFVLGAGGSIPDPEKCRAITECAPPKNQTS